MALVPYNPRAPTHVSHTSTSSSRKSRNSSHTYRTPTSAPSRHTSSRSSSSSSASSTGSSYTCISTQTFGMSSRPGYAPGQAPHDYFYNEDVREEWDSAPIDAYGRRIRQTKIRGRGSEWPAQSAYASSMSSIGGSPSERGSRHLRYDEAEDEASDNDTVSPTDSISQVSSQPSRLSSRPSRRPGMSEMGSARYHYPQSGYSQRPSMIDAGFGGINLDPYGSRVGSGGISVANGRLVRVQRPE